MVYESSYESGRKPFQPNVTRGYWSSPTDFFIACLGLAFKMDVYSMSWLYFFESGFYGIIPYMACLGIYVVPIVVLQSFIGQFSSSGFIAAFRISPIFKGMGYMSLAINILVLNFYGIFATIPLFYLLHVFEPILPWSCDAMHVWSQNITDEEKVNICNITLNAVENDTTLNRTDEFAITFLNHHIPSAIFFKSHLGNNLFGEKNEFSISWKLVLSNFIFWGIIAGIFYHCVNIQKFAKMLRYLVFSTLTLLLVCLLRFLLLPGAMQGFLEYFHPTFEKTIYDVGSTFVYVLSSFGAGWGTVVSLASFNNFRTNIMKLSWIIALCQMFIFILFAMVAYLLDSHFREITNHNFWHNMEHMWMIYLSSGTALASMEYSNFWCLLFYTMLILAALVMMVTQLYSVLISIFDEFEFLRSHKFNTTFGLICCISITSLYFCTNNGVMNFSALSMDAIVTQTALNLLLLLVILWIYGRERFQRDIEFMLSQPFPSWKISMLRYVTPIFLTLILIATFLIAAVEHAYATFVEHIFAIVFMILPWLIIPGYGIWCLLQATGSFTTRFKRCCRPTDWYPFESEERQRYEEAMNNMDVTHQLHEVVEDVF